MYNSALTACARDLLISPKKYFRDLLSAVLLACSLNASAETIQFGANESPPYWSARMPEQGMCGEILQALSKEAGLSAQIIFKPLKRLIEDTQNNDLGNPDFYIQEQDFAGIIPIVLYQASFYYYLPNHPEKIALTSLEELKKYKIGILSGTLIDRPTFESQGLQFETSYSQASIFKKLKLGRIDLAIEIDFIAQQIIQELYPQQQADFIRIGIHYKPSAIALMISEQTPNAKRIVQRYRTALSQLIADGRYQKILAKYYQKTPIPSDWYSQLARYDALYNYGLDP